MSKPTVGYSGTPLAKKLGIAESCRVAARRTPDTYMAMLEPIPPNVVFESKVSKKTDIVHVFSDSKIELMADLKALRSTIKPDAAVWVSWPKKASKISTDISEATIRDIALPLGFVDIKVCAVNEVWSGLKLVIRKELRDKKAP